MIKHEIKQLHEANCERGNPSWGRRLVEAGEPMEKKRIEGRRGGRAGTTQRSERSDMTTRAQSTGSSRGGKCDDCAGKQRVLTWGRSEAEMALPVYSKLTSNTLTPSDCPREPHPGCDEQSKCAETPYPESCFEPQLREIRHFSIPKGRSRCDSDCECEERDTDAT